MEPRFFLHSDPSRYVRATSRRRVTFTSEPAKVKESPGTYATPQRLVQNYRLGQHPKEVTIIRIFFTGN